MELKAAIRESFEIFAQLKQSLQGYTESSCNHKDVSWLNFQQLISHTPLTGRNAIGLEEKILYGEAVLTLVYDIL